MYTHKRYSGWSPVKRNSKKAILKIKNRSFVVRAVLYICIAAMLFISFIFINSAAVWAASSKQIVFKSEGQPEDNLEYYDAFKDNLVNPEFILKQEIPVIYGVNLEEIAAKDQNDIEFEVLPDDIKMEIVQFSIEHKDFYIGAEGPQILIYHSHAEEAYRQIKGDEYTVAGKSYYTRDFEYSVTAVGEILKKELEHYGYRVLHDTTDHMRQGLNTAYSKSLVTMQNYVKKYPTIKIYIDIHRDAYDDIEAGSKDFVTINGDECARAMFVVGTSDKLNEKANYESNYKLAYAITNELQNINKGFTRRIRLKPGRSNHYNQQMSDMCLLIEVGHNANSLEQAKNTAKYIALALSRVVDISGP